MPRLWSLVALALVLALCACSLILPYESTPAQPDAQADGGPHEASEPPDTAGTDGMLTDGGQGDVTTPWDSATDVSSPDYRDAAPLSDSTPDILLDDAGPPPVVINNPAGNATCQPGSACEVNCTAANSCTGTISCSDGPCIVNCTAQNSCTGMIDCGSGPCEVWCSGQYSCGGGIDCGPSSSCTVHCDIATCGGPITCGPGRCDIDCFADNSCGGNVDCSTSCACTLDCREGECISEACPTDCAQPLAMGCSSSRAGCDTCPP